MKRRNVLAATGVAVTGSVGAYLLFGNSASAAVEHTGTLDATFAANGDYLEDGDPGDGRPPAFENPPASPDADPTTFETLDVNDEAVRLAPIDVVERWYRRGEARFVDARGVGQYEESHVYGAVSSSAEQGSSGGAIDAWPSDDRVVTYCGCPHHLSSMRAAGLEKDGHTTVYALDEGYIEWSDRGYPMAGTAFTGSANADLREWTIDGSVDPRFAGQYAWARTDSSQEAVPIREGGEFTIHVRFPDVTSETPVELSTPAFATTRPLGDLASGVVKAR